MKSDSKNILEKDGIAMSYNILFSLIGNEGTTLLKENESSLFKKKLYKVQFAIFDKAGKKLMDGPVFPIQYEKKYLIENISSEVMTLIDSGEV